MDISKQRGYSLLQFPGTKTPTTEVDNVAMWRRMFPLDDSSDYEPSDGDKVS